MAPLNRIKAAEANKTYLLIPKISEDYERAPAQKILDKTMMVKNFGLSFKKEKEVFHDKKKGTDNIEDTMSDYSYGYVF